MDRPLIKRVRILALRSRRWAREIALAVIITIAALVFLTVSIVGRHPAGPFSTAGKQTPR
jgi:hypothetical protein